MTLDECRESLEAHTKEGSFARELGNLFLVNGQLTTSEIMEHFNHRCSSVLERLRLNLRSKKKCGWDIRVDDIPGKNIKRYRLIVDDQ